MRRALISFVTVAVGAAVLALPASAAHAVDPPTVRVSPGVSSVVVGGTRQLTAAVANVTDTSVTWSLLRGPGSVSPTGLYTPPAQYPADPVAVLRAESVEAPGVVGDAVVHIASGVPGGAFGAEVPTAHDGGQDADTGDVTGDGVADVVLLENCCNDLKTFRIVTLSWNGSGFTRTATGYQSTVAANGITPTNDFVLDLELGDLDEDGDLDVLVPFGSAQAQTWRYQVWRNNGAGAFTPDAKAPVSGGFRSGAKAKLTDFDGDGHLDAVRLEYFGNVLLETGNGDGTFDPPVLLMSTFNAQTFSLGDLTGDGRPEVAVGIRTTSNVTQDIFEVGINNGFGSIANEVTYTTGIDAEPYIAEVTGDGWNDLVVAVGGESYSNPANSPKLVVFPNLGTGTGAAGPTSTLALPIRPHDLHVAHVDDDGVLDLAGGTFRGPVLLRRTGAGTFSHLHTASLPLRPHHVTIGDVTGDGRVDAFANGDDESRFWPGSADATLAFSVDPTVTHVNATLTAQFSASLRNVTTEPKLTWTASRGTFGGDFFDNSTYTAPSSASPSGTPVTITATLTGTSTKATRTITVMNDKFQGPSPSAQNTRQIVTDPGSATTLYAATAAGVFRSTNGGGSFAPLGTTGMTGTDAKALTVVRGGSAVRLLAVFGTTLYKYDLLNVTDWAPTGVTSAAAVSAAPGTPIVFATSGGVVRASTDGGESFSTLTGASLTAVNRLEAIDNTSFWATRSSAPYVAHGAVSGTALTVTTRETPAALPANALAVDPDDRAVAYVAPNDATRPLYKWDAGGGAWSALTLPHVVDRLAVSPTGALLALNTGGVPGFGGNAIYKSLDGGAGWYSVNRGFPNGTSLTAVAHRADGLDLVGTSGGIYTPVEQTPPAAPEVTGGPSGTTSPGGADAFAFTFGTVADASSYLCALDDTAWAACTSPKTYSGPLADGGHTFSVVALDANGNESAPGTRAWTVDATPAPVPSITSGPTGLVTSTSATFEFTLSGDAAGATCALDSETPASCTTGKSYTSLSQGAHTFSVRSVDPVGNLSAAATRSWTVDTLPPAFPGFWSVPQPVSPSSSAFFQWQDDASATYACTIDGSPVTCSDFSAGLSGLTEGSHTFAVVATDEAGNSIGNSYAWTVDLTNPDAPAITAKPDVSTTATSASFTFASPSADVSYYLCALDSGGQFFCDGSKQYTDLGVGAHAFSVTAVDEAGRQSTATTYEWTISVGTPAITGGPSGLVNTRTAAFTFTGLDGATFACSLDGVAPVTCASGVTYTDLGDGAHTFAVTQTKNGATSAATTREWTVDATAPPSPELTAVPPLRTKNTAAAFAWTPDGALTYSCALDGAPVTCGAGGYTAESLGQGAHQFVLTTRDAAQNPSTASYSWTVDTTGPTVSISTKPGARVASTSASFEFGSAAADLAGFTCTLDGVASACTSPRNLSSLAQGEHTFSVVGVDDLGNAGGAATHTWTVDTAGPVVTFSATPPLRTADPAATFDWGSADDDVESFICTIDGVTDDCGALDLSSLSPGQHTFSVVGVDDLGNIGAPATHTWTIDQSGPPVTLTATPAALTNSTVASFSFSSAAADVVGFTCTLDGTETSCTSPYSAPGLAPGAHEISIVATDDVGNTGEAATFAWVVDTAAPVTTIATPSAALKPSHVVSWNEPVTNVTTGTVRLLLTGTTTAVPATLTCRTAANAPVSCASGSTRNVVLTPAAPLTPGQLYTISVNGVKDLAGNAATGSRGYRASTSEQENGLAAKPAWRKASSSVAQGGSYHIADLRSATASYTFTGTAVTWYGLRGPTYGTADLYIDNVLKASKVNFYSTRISALTRTISGLSNAKHTLRIVVRGEKGSTSGKGTDVAVDAFKVGSALSATPPVTFAWARKAASAASGGAYAVEDYAGASFTMSFRGRAISWVTMLGPNMGKATVYIDGVSKGTFDNWASATKYGAVRRFGGLTDKVHTIKITVLGQRRTGASGTNVVVDRFAITP